MLVEKLNQTINVLDDLIDITQEDIKNIKEANHNLVFNNMQKKESLAKQFSLFKSEIDSILASRNRPVEEIFSKEEEILFDKFRDKLNQFYSLHKRFSKLALSVANFYNTLWKKINSNEKSINYKEETFKNSYLQLKG